MGFLQVHLYRPFSVEHFVKALPRNGAEASPSWTAARRWVATGEPLYQDVCTAFASSKEDLFILGGRYGLSSKDTDPAQIVACFDNLISSNPISSFTIGIHDDVTHLLSAGCSLCSGLSGDVVQCKFWGLGSDGTVGANHNTVQIINTYTDKFAQAYFEYDAKKSFGITKSHLRFRRQAH